MGDKKDAEQEKQDAQVEIWKVKKLIKSLQAARGNGTSMISLVIPPKDQVSRISKMLTDEYGTASNIKSPISIGTETNSISTFHLLVIPSEIVGVVAYNQAKSLTKATGGVV